jgi:hypothetical protein
MHAFVPGKCGGIAIRADATRGTVPGREACMLHPTCFSLFRSFGACAAFAAVLSTLGGCASDVESSVSDNVTKPARDELGKQAGSYSGQWTGTWRSPDGTSHPARATLVQDGLSVHGTFFFEENPCVPQADLTAAVTGDGLAADLKAGGMDLHYEVTYFDGASQDGELSALDPAFCAIGEGAKIVIHLARD